MTNGDNEKKPVQAGGFSVKIFTLARNLKILALKTFREHRIIALAGLALILLVAYRLISGYGSVLGWWGGGQRRGPAAGVCGIGAGHLRGDARGGALLRLASLFAFPASYCSGDLIERMRWVGRVAYIQGR